LEETIVISDTFITLGQALKEAAVIDSGGQAKWFLSEVPVWVNGEEEQRRGRKLYPGDRVTIDEIGAINIANHDE
jgi:S4 domain protein YaaA